MSGLSPVKVRVSSFQSVQDVEFEVSGFTCVTGPSNIGKSALIRAMSGALLNDPVVGMVRLGQKFCTVDFQAGDWGIKWEKGEKEVNRYWLPGSDKPLDKLGQGQTDVTVALGFGSVRVGKDTIQPWFASQFDPVFLMDQSGPAVTDFISEVTRLKIYQDAITINVRARRRLLDESKVRDEDVARAVEKEAKFKDLDQVLAVESDLEAQLASVEEYGRKVRRIRELDESLEADAAAIRTLSAHKDVRMPPDSAAADLHAARRMNEFHGALEEGARSIIALRPAADVSVPSAPAPAEIGEVASCLKYLQIPAMRAAVDGLQAASAVAAPDPGPALAEDAASAASAASWLARLEEARASLEVFSHGSPDLPAAADDPLPLRAAARLASSASSLEQEMAELAARALDLDAELESVESELESIPVCPTCSQVFVPASHQAHA